MSSGIVQKTIGGPAYLGRIVTLADLLDVMSRLPLCALEMRDPRHFVLLLFQYVGAFNHRHKVLRFADLPLQTPPYLIAGENGRSAGRVDRLCVCAVDVDHGGGRDAIEL